LRVGTVATLPFALYDAFSDTAFGGSPAGVVSDAAWLDVDARRRIARELGAPATGFVTACGGNSIGARFLSTVTELPMCGHGTLALMTRMLELGNLNWNGGERIDLELCLPSATAAVEISRRDDGRPLVMLDIQPPRFRRDSLDSEILATLLGLGKEDFQPEWPMETASGDFVHLVVPARDLAAMRRIGPDFGGLTLFCREHGIDTVAVFCTEVERPDHSLHVRDFCPAVGVPESAAAGTTNGALTSYLIRHGILRDHGDGRIAVQAEQGHEIERPSSIRSVVSMNAGTIARLQVGGVATKVLDGQLHVPGKTSR
jgi:trans-2,3-dihydro-3-hydroxyanthranilate isomerase